MVRTARIEPIFLESDENQPVIGWKVVDISNPEQETEVSRHASEPEALQAAREFEGSPEYTIEDQEEEGAENQHYALRQVNAPNSPTGIRYEVYEAATGISQGYFESEQAARELQLRLQELANQTNK